MHLTDQQIQNHYSGESEFPISALTHLDTCRACRHAFDTYRVLFAELATVPQPNLSAEFADEVMHRLANERAASRKAVAHWRNVALAATGCGLFATVGVLTILYVDPRFVDTLTIGMRGSILSVESALRNFSGSVSTDLNIKPLMLLFSVLTLGGISLLDRLIVRFRQAL